MSSNPAALADRLFALVARTRARVSGDPFGNPVLSIAFDVMRRIESDEIDHDAVVALIRYLRDQAFSDRAARLARYVGSVDPDVNENALTEVARNVLFSGDSKDKLGWDAFRAQLERTRYAAVFTGHPTFALPPQVGRHLAEHACGAMLEPFESHRPLPVTLVDEFEQAAVAIANGRDALDRFNAALLSAARDAWPERWTTLVPRPGVTAEGLHSAIIGLDMPAVLPLLAEIFPENADHSIAYDYAEPAGPRATGPYAREHAEIFVPMARLFDCIREISTAVTHEVGAFG